MSEIQVRIDVYGQNDYREGDTPKYVLEIVVSSLLKVGSLIKQVLNQVGDNLLCGQHGLLIRSTGKWLSESNSVSYYEIKDGDCLDLRSKRTRIKIRTLDGSLRTVLIDETLATGVVVSGVCRKLQIHNFEEYSFVLQNATKNTQNRKESANRDHQSEDGQIWLSENDTLREQGAFNGGEILLKRKYFFNCNSVDETDPVQLSLLYSQTNLMILSGKYPCSFTEACMFAALQLQIDFGSYEDSKKRSISQCISRITPFYFSKDKRMRKPIIAEYQKLIGMSPGEAKLRYVKLSRSLKTFGTTFYSVDILDSANKPKQAYIGITKTKITLVDAETMATINEWPFSHIRRWSILSDTVTIDFGDYSDVYLRLKSRHSEEISNLISGYINIILKRKKMRKSYRVGYSTTPMHIKSDQAKSNYFKPKFSSSSSGKKFTLMNNSVVRSTRNHLGGSADLKSPEYTNADSEMLSANQGFTGQDDGELDPLPGSTKNHANGEVIAHNQSPRDALKSIIYDTCTLINASHDFLQREPYNSENISAENVSAELCFAMELGTTKDGVPPNEGEDNAGMKEIDKYILISDVTSILTLVPVILEAHNKLTNNSCDSDDAELTEFKNNMNTLARSSSSVVGFFEKLAMNNTAASLKVRGALSEKVRQLLQNLSNLMTSMMKSGSESDDKHKKSIVSNAYGLINPAVYILKSLCADITTERQQEVIVKTLENLVNILQRFSDICDDIAIMANNREIKAEGSQLSTLRKFQDQLKDISMPIISCLAVLAPIPETFKYDKPMSSIIGNTKAILKDGIAFCESLQPRNDIIEYMNRCMSEFTIESLNLRKNMRPTGIDSVDEKLIQFCITNESLDAILKPNMTMDEFTECVNDLSLSTVNFFNQLKLVNGEGESPEEVEDIKRKQELMRDAYSSVMMCVRDYAADTLDPELRESLVEAVENMRTAMSSCLEGGKITCQFYEFYRLSSELFSKANNLTSYSRAALCNCNVATPESSSLRIEVDKFSKFAPLIASTLRSYRLHPDASATKIGLIGCSNALCTHITSLISSIKESEHLFWNQDTKKLLMDCCVSTQVPLSRLMSSLSELDVYSLKIDIASSLSQLNDHIEDLVTAREKVSSLIPLNGYNVDIALNDYENSLRYSRTCTSKIFFSSAKFKDFSFIGPLFSQIVSVLQCVSFSVLGICSVTDDIESRKVNISSVIYYYKAISSAFTDIEQSIGDPEECSRIIESYRERILEAQDGLLVVFRGGKHLIEIGNSCNKLIALLSDENPSRDALKEIASHATEFSLDDIKKGIEKFSEDISGIISSLSAISSLDKAESAALLSDFHEAWNNYSRQCAAYYLESNCDKALIESLRGSSELVEAIMEEVVYPQRQLGDFSARRIQYLKGSLEDYARKILSIVKTGSDKEILSVNSATKPLTEIVLRSPVSLSSLTNLQKQDEQEYVKIVESISNSSHESSDAIQHLIDLVSSGNTKDTIKVHAENFIETVRKLTEDLSSFYSAIAATHNSSNNGSSVQYHRLLDGVMNEIKKDLLGAEAINNDNIKDWTAKNINNFYVVYRLCKEACNRKDVSDAEREAFSNICTRIGSSLSGMVIVNSQNPTNIETSEREKDLECCKNLLGSLEDIISSPTLRIPGEMVNDNQNSREFMDRALKFANHSRNILSLLNLYTNAPKDETLSVLKEASAEFIKAINESACIPKSSPTVIAEYDEIISRIESCSSKLLSLNAITKDSESEDKPEALLDITGISEPWNKNVDEFNLSNNINNGISQSVNPLPASRCIVLVNNIIRECNSFVNSAIGDGSTSILESVGVISSLGEVISQLSNETSLVDSTRDEIKTVVGEICSIIKNTRNLIIEKDDKHRQEEIASQVNGLIQRLSGMSQNIKAEFKEYLGNNSLNPLIDSIAMSPYIESRSDDKVEGFKKVEVSDVDEYVSNMECANRIINEGFTQASLQFFESGCPPEKMKMLCSSLSNRYSSFRNYMNNCRDLIRNKHLKSQFDMCVEQVGINIMKISELGKECGNKRVPPGLKEITEDMLQNLSNSTINCSKFLHGIVAEVDSQQEVVETISDIIKSIDDKIVLAKESKLNPMSFDEEYGSKKGELLQQSRVFVESLKEYSDSTRDSSKAEVYNLANRALVSFETLKSQTIRCMASMTPLNKDDQVNVLENLKNVCTSFSQHLNQTFNASLGLNESNSKEAVANEGGTSDHNGADAYLLDSLKATGNLITAIRNTDNDESTSGIHSVIEASKKAIDDSRQILKNTIVSDKYTHSDVNTVAESVFKSIPDIINKITSSEICTRATITPALNKFNSQIADMCASFASCEFEDKECKKELAEKVEDMCDISHKFLASVQNYVCLDEGSRSRSELQESAKEFNMKLVEIIDSSKKATLKNATVSEKKEGIGAELEFESVRSVIEEIYDQINSESRDQKGDFVNPDLAVLADYSNDYRLISAVTIPLLKCVALAYREVLCEAKKSGKYNSDLENEFVKLMDISKKFAFSAVEVCQIFSSVMMGESSISYLTSKSRSSYSLLEQLNSMLDSLSLYQTGYTSVSTFIAEYVEEIRGSLTKLIRLGHAGVVFTRAESLVNTVAQKISRGETVDSILPSFNAFGGVRKNTDDEISRKCIYSPISFSVKDKVQEMNAKIKILKMEKDLEDSRVGSKKKPAISNNAELLVA